MNHRYDAIIIVAKLANLLFSILEDLEFKIVISNSPIANTMTIMTSVNRLYAV